MRIWVLGSGSRGNALVIESGDSRLLVDAGFPARTLAQRMRSVGIDPESIGHCVLTHEHIDHSGGAGVGARKWGWEVHGTAGTLAACPDLRGARTFALSEGAPITIAGFEVVGIGTPHDAAASIALHVTSSSSGARAGIAYDLGSIPESLCRAFNGVDILVAETNHDPDMLRAGPYPPSVQARIASRTGHLDNGTAASFVRRCTSSALAHVVLAHISEKCNEPREAHSAVSGALKGTRFRGKLTVAEQGRAVGPFAAGGSVAASGAQLSLF